MNPGECIHLNGLDIITVEPERLRHTDLLEGLRGEIGQLHPVHEQMATRWKEKVHS